MSKFSFGFIAFIALSFNSLAQSDVSKSRWNSKQITIDGNDREWAKPLNFYDDKTGLLFAISNDNKNLYFAFSCNNEFKMRKLMNTGWSVELSSKEKNRKFKATLSFPAVKMEGIGQKRPGSEFEKKVPGNPFINGYQLQSVITKGFLSGQAQIKLHNRGGIDIAVGADSLQNLVYEIAIPVKELMSENLVQLNELITMSVTVNAMERPNGGGSQSGRGGSRQGGGMSEMGGGSEGGGMGGGMDGGRSGGGMGGGRSGGGIRQSGNGDAYSDRRGLLERASFKQKFVLTKK